MTRAYDRLAGLFGPALRTAVPLAPYTWMRVGGPAEFLLEADTADAVIRARAACRRWGIPFVLLGGGSNVVVDDAGLAGLVVIHRAAGLHWDDDRMTLTAAGGADLDTVVAAVSRRGWGDLTFAAGIPGTVGGGLAGGAGAYGHLLVDGVRSARVLGADGSVAEVAAADLGVGYRRSDALERGDIVLAVTFAGFRRADAADLAARIAEIRADRVRKHPAEDLPCAGSFFKNLPPVESGGRRVPAGRVLDACGAKGMRHGGAAVFERHANIIVNTGGATAADILALADALAERVRRERGITLEREVRYLRNKR